MNESPSSDARHQTGFVILITLVATIGGFLFGFDSGVINGTVDGLRTAFNSDSVGTGLNVSSMLLGCAAGAFAAGRLADRYGRRSVLLVSAVFFTVSAWGSGIATGSLEFVIYRVLGGFAVGAASVLVPAYISEVAPARYRGMLSALQQIAIISGLFFSFLSNYLIAAAAGSSLDQFAFGYEAWRWMFWVELVPAIGFFFALLCIPESPRYLVAAGKKERALHVLGRLMGGWGAGQVRRDPVDARRRSSPSALQRCAWPLRVPPDRLGRHRPGSTPTVCRHQRGLLLWGGALAISRFHRKPRLAHQRDQRCGQHRRLRCCDCGH